MVARDWTRLAEAWEWLNAYKANKEIDMQFERQVFGRIIENNFPETVVDAWEESRVEWMYENSQNLHYKGHL